MAGDYHLRHSDIINPHKLLAFGIIGQAIRDCSPTRSKADPIRAIDALAFLACAGAEFAEFAGWEVDPDHWLEVLSEKI